MDQDRRAWVRAALLAGGAFAVAAALVRLAGFDSISDDDHARVVIAQGFAITPRLDPSGTSWLPAPFWIQGALLRLLGPGLPVARALAVLAAGASGALLVAGGAVAGLDPRGALLAAALALSIPLVSLLGAAPVPELPAAVAVAFALLHLASPPLASSRPASSPLLAPLPHPSPAVAPSPQASLERWALAAAALFLATLARYEAWLPAAFFALVTAIQARRRPALLPFALLAAAGPLLWMVWNLHAHGHPLAFARRVAAYRAGLGVISEGVFLYPDALLQEAPWALALGLLGLRQRGLRLPLAGVGVTVLALALAELRGGAPTHHPERALLGPMLVLVVASVAAVQALRGRGAGPWVLRGAGPWVLLVVAALATGARRWRPTRGGLGAHRGAEVALGDALRGLLAPGERALLVADSYGYFATQAALARPGALQVVVPRAIDPRSTLEGDPLENEATLAALWRGHPGVSWLVLRDGQAPWLGPRSGERRLPGARLLPASALPSTP